MPKPPKEHRQKELANYAAQRERNEAQMEHEAERQADLAEFAALPWAEKVRGARKASAGPQENKALEPSLEDKSLEELYALAQEAGIAGRSKMTKSELIEALQG